MNMCGVGIVIVVVVINDIHNPRSSYPFDEADDSFRSPLRYPTRKDGERWSEGFPYASPIEAGSGTRQEG
jgi:hypothetical protein